MSGRTTDNMQYRITAVHVTLAACLVLVAGVVVSCGDDNSVTPIQTRVLWPLSVGNWWEYADSSWDKGVYEGDWVDTIAILSTYVRNGITWYGFGDTLGDRFEFYTVHTNRSDGLWLGHVSDTGLAASLYLPYPAEAGDSTIRGHDTVIVTSVDHVITCAAGSFTCYEYEYRMSIGAHSTYWYAPGTGLVRARHVEPTHESVMWLTNYHIR